MQPGHSAINIMCETQRQQQNTTNKQTNKGHKAKVKHVTFVSSVCVCVCEPSLYDTCVLTCADTRMNKWFDQYV